MRREGCQDWSWLEKEKRGEDPDRAGIKRASRTHLDDILDPTPRVLFDERLGPDQRLDLSVESVRHEFELAVGRDERDGPVVLEPRQADALVEFHVLHLDRLAARG